MFMSTYMLRTFAPHLAMIEKSCLKDPEPQLGALAIAAAAVSHVHTSHFDLIPTSIQVEVAFSCFESGIHKPPQGEFEKVGGAGLSDKWLVAAANLYDKQARWDEMMQRARAQAKTRAGPKRGRNVMLRAQRDRNVVPHSSSPARPE